MSEHAVPEPKALRRSRSDRLLGGVCGGLGAYFDIHPAVFRVAFVVLTLASGAGILVYLAALLVIPADGKEESIAEAIILTVLRRPRRRSGAAVPVEGRSRRGFFAVLGIVLVTLVALAAVLAVTVVKVFDVDLDHGIGERAHVVRSAGDIRDEYRLGAGELRIDLSALELPPGETRVRARLGVGELKIAVPVGAAVRARAHAEMGEIELLGEQAEGRDVELERPGDGPRLLVLDARVGFGQITVTEEEG